jgi:hypothetical protein
MAYVLQPLILRRVRHSRMLLAGIQAEFGLDPRLKHSGVTVWESHLLTPAKFSKGARRIWLSMILNFVLFVAFVASS